MKGMEPARGRPGPRAVDRVAAAFLLALLVAGSLALWVAVPAAVLKALTPLSESTAYHLGVGLIGVPAAMIVFALGLFWVNGLYLRVTGHWRVDEDGAPRRLRGPLEPILLWSLLVAVVAIGVWFFALAENPVLTV